jgi:hypothetical protein
VMIIEMSRGFIRVVSGSFQLVRYLFRRPTRIKFRNNSVNHHVNEVRPLKDIGYASLRQSRRQTLSHPCIEAVWYTHCREKDISPRHARMFARVLDGRLHIGLARTTCGEKKC